MNIFLKKRKSTTLVLPICCHLHSIQPVSFNGALLCSITNIILGAILSFEWFEQVQTLLNLTM